MRESRKGMDSKVLYFYYFIEGIRVKEDFDYIEERRNNVYLYLL